MQRRDALVFALLCSPGLQCSRAEPATMSARPPGAPTVSARVAFTRYPSPVGACTADGDCALVGALRTEPGLTGCCPRCGEYVAGTRGWTVSASAACTAAGECSDEEACSLPTVNPYVAACEAAQCVVHRNPTVWR